VHCSPEVQVAGADHGIPFNDSPGRNGHITAKYNQIATHRRRQDQVTPRGSQVIRDGRVDQEGATGDLQIGSHRAVDDQASAGSDQVTGGRLRNHDLTAGQVKVIPDGH